MFWLFSVSQLYHHALAMAWVNDSLFSRFVRWFDSDSPEIEMGRRLAEKYPFLPVNAGKGHSAGEAKNMVLPGQNPERMV